MTSFHQFVFNAEPCPKGGITLRYPRSALGGKALVWQHPEHKHHIKYTLHVSLKAVLDWSLPYEPNHRTKHKSNEKLLQEIAATAVAEQGEAGYFHAYNNGIRYSASAVVVEKDGSVSVEFRRGDGCIDGGTTYAALLYMNWLVAQGEAPPPAEGQYVEVTIFVGLPSRVVKGSVRTLSNHKPHDWVAIQAAGGHFKWIDGVLNGAGRLPLATAPGDRAATNSDRINAVHAIRWLAALDVTRCDLSVAGNKLAARSVSGGNVTANFPDDSPRLAKHFGGVLLDVLRLVDILHIACGAEKQGNRARVAGFARGSVQKGFGQYNSLRESGTEGLVIIPNYVVPKHLVKSAMIIPLLGAFRSLLEHDETTNTLRWQGGRSFLAVVTAMALPHLLEGVETYAHSHVKTEGDVRRLAGEPALWGILTDKMALAKHAAEKTIKNGTIPMTSLATEILRLLDGID